jgi:3-(3-hydroxy-phenyl)propionate hydroxylase
MVKTSTEPPIEPGDRVPDGLVHTSEGREVRLHDLARDRFIALYFTDVRRRPLIPATGSPALAHFAISRWDAPFDSGVRDRALLDPGDRLKRRLGVADDTLVLVRPDEHIAAIRPMATTSAADLYTAIVGKSVPE